VEKTKSIALFGKKCAKARGGKMYDHDLQYECHICRNTDYKNLKSCSGDGCDELMCPSHWHIYADKFYCRYCVEKILKEENEEKAKTKKKDKSKKAKGVKKSQKQGKDVPLLPIKCIDCSIYLGILQADCSDANCKKYGRIYGEDEHRIIPVRIPREDLEAGSDYWSFMYKDDKQFITFYDKTSWSSYEELEASMKKHLQTRLNTVLSHNDHCEDSDDYLDDEDIVVECFRVRMRHAKMLYDYGDVFKKVWNVN
jgi:hypothetical protein